MVKNRYKAYGWCTLFIFLFAGCNSNLKPRVFVFTDINIDAGDPDDRQSLVHLLWYADELQIEGVVPDRWNAGGVEACQLVIEAYAKDYTNHSFAAKGYPTPGELKQRIANTREDAARLFSTAASKKNSPLYVLVWGNMELVKSMLLERPEFADNIRLITIGTGLMAEEDIAYMPADWGKSEPCQHLNWNGFGRNDLQ